jgi:hypothetical protein
MATPCITPATPVITAKAFQRAFEPRAHFINGDKFSYPLLMSVGTGIKDA